MSHSYHIYRVPAGSCTRYEILHPLGSVGIISELCRGNKQTKQRYPISPNLAEDRQTTKQKARKTWQCLQQEKRKERCRMLAAPCCRWPTHNKTTTWLKPIVENINYRMLLLEEIRRLLVVAQGIYYRYIRLSCLLPKRALPVAIQLGLQEGELGGAGGGSRRQKSSRKGMMSRSIRQL